MPPITELSLNPFGLAALFALFFLAFTDMVSSWPMVSRVAYAVIFAVSSLHLCSSLQDSSVSLFIHSISFGSLVFTFCMYLQGKLKSQEFLGYYDIDSRSQYVHQDP